MILSAPGTRHRRGRGLSLAASLVLGAALVLIIALTLALQG